MESCKIWDKKEPVCVSITGIRWVSRCTLTCFDTEIRDFRNCYGNLSLQPNLVFCLKEFLLRKWNIYPGYQTSDLETQHSALVVVVEHEVATKISTSLLRVVFGGLVPQLLFQSTHKTREKKYIMHVIKYLCNNCLCNFGTRWTK